ncbi:MAG: pyridoxal 5'-phosphate synthase glutaminase subunit PdxT [Bacillota bacterium]
MKIGILALQGSVIEHSKMLSLLSDGGAYGVVGVVEVKTPAQLAAVDGLIIPGGESTTIGKLLKDFDIFEPLKARISSGMPVWGTCAGMILLAKEVVGEAPHLGLMDVRVKRNAFGRQIASFSTEVAIPEISSAGPKIPLVFIRAPWIEDAGKAVESLCIVDERIVAARQGNMLVTSFHPELTLDTRVHEYFLKIVQEAIG